VRCRIAFNGHYVNLNTLERPLIRASEMPRNTPQFQPLRVGDVRFWCDGFGVGWINHASLHFNNRPRPVSGLAD
jgi:hypothetical protein